VFDLGLTFNDVLLIPQYSSITSRSGVSLKSNLTPKLEINFPVLATNMDTIVGVEMAESIYKSGSLSLYPRFANIETQVKEVKTILDNGSLTIPSVGIKKGEMDRAIALLNLGLKIIFIDVAHAHQQTCLDFIKALKSKFPDIEIIAGAVATYEGACALFESGVDTVKVGIGSGSTCTTRIMTGSGMPQLTAVFETYRAAKKYSKLVISDAGMKNSGDVVKALAAGASTVLTGNLFAGCQECPGEIIEKDGQKYKSYNGSTSLTEKLRQLKKDSTDKSPDYVKHVEGLERTVPLRGQVASVIDQLEKGIRSGLTYSGARNIKELHQKARFIQVTSSIIQENLNRNLTN